MPEIPETMKAIRMYEYGGPEVLKVETHPVPVPGDNQVLVKVVASSVSWWDYAYRHQLIKPIPGRGALPLPQQLGREASGDVVLVGKNVRDFSVGDKIVTMACPACGQCTFCQQGFDNLCIRTELPAHSAFGNYAEYIVRDANSIFRAPAHLGYEELACLIWSYGTVIHMIDGRAKLRPGESVLITGASGGMGTAAIQLAKLAGAGKIIGLSSAVDKYDELKETGADVLLNYKDADILEQIKSHTAMNMGVDVVLDSVGGSMAALGIEALRMGGRAVLAATMGGSKLEIDVLKLFVKNITIHGSRASRRQDQETILKLAAAGKIKPIISHRFPMDQIVEAQKLLEAGGHTGKIVLNM